jgi:hypothetical protein
MKISPVILRLPIIISFLLSSARATASDGNIQEHAFLIGEPSRTYEGEGKYADIKFSLWIDDPLKINWMAWSQVEGSRTYEDEPVIDEPYPGNMGVDDYVLVTLSDPSGRASEPVVMDWNDAEGRPRGPQAMLFGKSELAPPVVRTDPQGEVMLLDEGGVFDEFILEGGPGYYVFHMEFSNAYGPTGKHPVIYLLMDVAEGYQIQRPIRHKMPGLDMPFFYTDNESGGHRYIPPPPPPPPPPDDDDHHYRRPFPPIPEPEEPIPEPATMGLCAVGLGLMGWIGRRRRAPNP